MEIRERSRDDARREGRRVHLVLRVQDHRHVEGTRLLLGGRLAAEHRQEVLGVRKGRIGLDRLEAAPAPVVSRDDRRKLRDQTRGLASLARSVDRRLDRIGERERRHGGPQELHRRRAARVRVDELRGRGRQLACAQLVAECGELLG
jgi:hypothetical protein